MFQSCTHSDIIPRPTDHEVIKWSRPHQNQITLHTLSTANRRDLSRRSNSAIRFCLVPFDILLRQRSVPSSFLCTRTHALAAHLTRTPLLHCLWRHGIRRPGASGQSGVLYPCLYPITPIFDPTPGPPVIDKHSQQHSAPV